MKGFQKIGYMLFALLMLSSMTACKDDIISKGKTDEDLKDPITRAYLHGKWTFDIDRINEINLGAIQYDFNDTSSVIITTIVDNEDSTLIRTETPIEWWQVDEQKLEEPNAYGHRDGLTIHTPDTTVTFYVKKVTENSLDIYFNINFGEHVVESPIHLVRQEYDGNFAQLIDMEDDEIAGMLKDLDEIQPDPEPSSDDESMRHWMSKIDGRRLVCDMAIPGTHDSSTDNVDILAEALAKAQGKNVGQQWDAGIRVYDLRVRNYDGDVEMCHGPVSNNYSFRETFGTIVDRVRRDNTEFATLFINTEGQPMPGFFEQLLGEQGFALFTKFITNGFVSIHSNQLDEELTRTLVYMQIKEELKKRNAEDMLCYFRPDLTLDEARGKIIIINRVPQEYKRNEWKFVGQALLKDSLVILSDDPENYPDIIKGYKESEWYTCNPKYFKDNDAFDKTRIAEYDTLSMIGHEQRVYGKTHFMIDNTATSSYYENVAGLVKLPVPNYVDASHNQYPKFMEINKQRRTSGFVRMDYGGVKEFGRVGLNQMIALGLAYLIAENGNIRAVAKSLAYTIKIENAALKTDVYGDELIKSVIDMNFVKVPLEKANIDKTFIEEKVGYTTTLDLTDYFPHDANTDLKPKSWESDNTKVATIDAEGHLAIVGYGNAIITATLQNGYKTIAYVCAPKTPIQAYDLGLSVLWGNRNLGSATPEYMGVPFAWGELKPRTYYEDEEYRWFTANGYSKYNKTDMTRRLDLEDDMAQKHLGGKWRMPTRKEVEELLSVSNITATTYNGANVLKIIKNGKTLYLPEAPYRNEQGARWADPAGGYFWSSEIFEDEATHAARWSQAYCARFELSSNLFFGLMNFNRYYAMPIRPVKDK